MKRLRQTMTATLAATLILLAFGAPSCDQGKTESNLRKIANASHRIGNTVDKGRQAVNELRRPRFVVQDGVTVERRLITMNEANALRQALLDVSNAAAEFNAEAAKHTVYDANAKAELQRWVDGLRAANLRLIANGTYHVKDDQARVQISATVGAIATLIQTITTLIPEAK